MCYTRPLALSLTSLVLRLVVGLWLVFVLAGGHVRTARHRCDGALLLCSALWQQASGDAAARVRLVDSEGAVGAWRLSCCDENLLWTS